MLPTVHTRRFPLTYTVESGLLGAKCVVSYIQYQAVNGVLIAAQATIGQQAVYLFAENFNLLIERRIGGRGFAAAAAAAATGWRWLETV